MLGKNARYASDRSSKAAASARTYPVPSG